jgi:CRISPR-associated protein Csc1
VPTTLHVVECRLTAQDSLYYASREAGEMFSTRPYLMHTALYYALGLLPSRFRTHEQAPRYVEHRDGSTLAGAVYIHPATTIDGEYHTKRFAAKGDQFRSASSRGSGNFKETGHQKMLTPQTEFQTFATTTDRETATQLTEQLPAYARVGKKSTTVRVETATHEAEIQEGQFSLGQPVGDIDYPEGAYDVRGNLHWERMVPVDLLTAADLAGRHAEVTPEWGSGPVSLPVDTTFLAQR